MIASKFTSLVLIGCLAQALLAQAQITNNSGGGERQPVLNANGTVVAYVAVASGVRDVFTVAPSGGTPVRRTTNAEVRIGGTTVFDAWPSLSISNDGNQITYWNAAGVHVLDISANTDTVVSPENLLPYPQISGDGTRVVFQGRVSGSMEVFGVSAMGGAVTQITSGSGPGRRLPHISRRRVVFQKLVGSFEEVFLHDLTTNTTTGPLTSNSGRGNRYARLTPEADKIVYEALVGADAIKEVFVYDIATNTSRQVSSASLRGDRLPVPTEDGEAYYELSVVNREVQRIDLATSTLVSTTASSSAGYRRTSVDRHGAIIVYQAASGNTTEVFARVFGYPPALSHYGQHGQPSTGLLQEADDVARRSLILGLNTDLPANSVVGVMIGVQQLAVPIPGAFNNFLYVNPLFSVPTVLNATGDIALAADTPVFLSGAIAFAQWAVNDPAANSLGWVTSKGLRIEFR